ncbi:hypothetical protein [Calothrix sp. PCC 6303]|uniref:hypothetical protein n=1 Tax=Calothrix sp. PCC 6303 TaxID=1170562 RepID=UPI00130E6AE3|nr:hypothetical protein [Calothrix sp. PCC 6303]
MENRIVLEDGDVVNVSPNQNPTGSATAKVGDIKKSIGSKLGNDQMSWGFNGVHGEALIQIGGGGWMKGRMVLQIMFYPSQSLPSQQKTQVSSPLDDLRKELNI